MPAAPLHLLGAAQSPGFVPLFRYPYSHEGTAEATQKPVRDALDRMGYELGYFTVDGADWYVQSMYQDALAQGKHVDYEALKEIYLDTEWRAIEFYDVLARATLGRSPKHVLILHESDINALFLGDLIRHIKSKGWKIIPAKEAFADPMAKEIPRGDVTQSRLAGLAVEAGYKGAVGNPLTDMTKLDELFRRAFLDR